jgi:hypothetical protein
MATARACRFLVGACAGAMGLLLATGLWLVRWYRPSASFGSVVRPPIGVRLAVGLHRVGAGTLLLAAGLLVGIRLVTAARRALPAVLAVLAGLGLVVTGRRLAWRVLGLRAARVNMDGAGMLFAAFDPIVRFVIGPGGEVTPARFRLVLGLHAVVLPVAVAGLLWAQRGRDNPTEPGT